MSEEDLEIEVKLPKIIKGPVVQADGTALVIGDRVKHRTFGNGYVIRLMKSDDIGDLVYIEFENGRDEILGVDFVKKLEK